MVRNAAGETILQQKVVAMEHTGETEQKIKEITKLIETGHPVNVCDNAGLLSKVHSVRNSLKLCLLGLTPLHEAANFGFPATTKILLKHGANIDATTKSDCAFKSDGVDENTVGPITALQDACSTLAGELLEGERSRKLEVIQILLEYNANTLLRNAQNKTPLQAGFITV